MVFIKKNIVWFAPLIIIFIGMSVLFSRNYAEVTEPPDSDWSREIELGTTPTFKKPLFNEIENNRLSVSFLTDQGVKQNIYNSEYDLISENHEEFPVDKFTSIFQTNNRLLYSDYYSLYDAETGEKIEAISGFYPLKDEIFYSKGNELFELQPDSLNKTSVLKLEDENTSVYGKQTSAGTFIVTDQVDEKGHHLIVHTIKNEQVVDSKNIEFSLNESEELKDLQISPQENQYSILLSTVQKQSMSGQINHYYYYAQSDWGQKTEFNEINFEDPHGGSELKEVSDLEMNVENKQATLLFKAYGETKTMFREPLQFNIYTAMIDDQNIKEINRISNTPNHSVNPTWMNSETIAWIDHGSGGENRLLFSSQDPALMGKAETITQANILQALGKTMGMLSYSIFGIMISVIWFIWPLLFIVVLMFTNSRAMDNDRSWIFYWGALIYLLAAILFKDRVFTDGVLAKAPEYLSFTGSTFAYLLGFALLSYAILKIGSRIKDWSIFVQLTYFVGIHITFVTVFFGPYLI